MLNKGIHPTIVRFIFCDSHPTPAVWTECFSARYAFFRMLIRRKTLQIPTDCRVIRESSQKVRRAPGGDLDSGRPQRPRQPPARSQHVTQQQGAQDVQRNLVSFDGSESPDSLTLGSASFLVLLKLSVRSSPDRLAILFRPRSHRRRLCQASRNSSQHKRRSTGH